MRERQQPAIAELARQQRSHGDARAQHTVERSTLSFVQQRPGRPARGEEQEHHPNRRRIKRHHGIVLVFSDNVARAHRNGHARIGIRRRNRFTAGVRGAFPLPQLCQPGLDSLPLFRSKSPGILIHVLRSLLRHDVGHRGHGNFLEQPGDHLRRDHVAAVLEQLDGRPLPIGCAKRNWIFSEAMRNDERHRSVAGFHGGFGGRRCVVRLLHALLRRGLGLHFEGPLVFESSHQPLRGGAVVFIDQQQAYLGRSVPASAEDHRKNSKKRNRQNEAQCQRASVAAQADECGANDGPYQSRNSLPVNFRNTDSRFGLRNEISASSCPALDAASSRSATSVA